jgi:3-methyladenine DNA glycosylase AlkD
MIANDLNREIRKKKNRNKAKILQRFFKTGEGEYGEGDLFLGITVPEVRKISLKYSGLSLKELRKNIKSKFHEERQAVLFILVYKFEKGNEKIKKEVYDFYIKNRRHINNWDLVDLTASKIVGAFLDGKDKSPLYEFAKSKNIWEKRISILSTFYYIKKGNCLDALKISEILKNDKEDLIQKAVGWALREIGKNCGQETEEKFLKNNYKTLPRMTLRYAIERFPEKTREFYLKK